MSSEEQPSVLSGMDLCMEDLGFSLPKPHPSGGKVVNLNHQTRRETLQFSTPLMMTWGAKEGTENNSDVPNGRFSMSFQFPSPEYPDADCERLLDKLKDLVQVVKTHAFEHSLEWFGKKLSQETVDEKFSDMLYYPKVAKGSTEVDPSKGPTWTVKIPKWKTGWVTEVYDEMGTPLFLKDGINGHLSPVEFLPPRAHVIGLVQCGGIWIISGRVSITWSLIQAMVQKPVVKLQGHCFLAPKDHERKRLREEVREVDAVPATYLPDSEDDEESGDPKRRAGVAEDVAQEEDDVLEEEDDGVESSPAPAPAPVPAPAPASASASVAPPPFALGSKSAKPKPARKAGKDGSTA
jgi:hypothetical protein